MENIKQNPEDIENRNVDNLEINDIDTEEADDTQAEQEVNTLENQLSETQTELEKQKKEYLFLMAEFDNFRKRTMREKSELIKNAGENVLKGLLPIVDDFERGLNAFETTDDKASLIEGIQLIYNKLIKYLNDNGVKEMESTGAEFDPELHEAVAQVPASSDEMKDKVIDTLQKGYMINDKVLRHARVAVAR